MTTHYEYIQASIPKFCLHFFHASLDTIVVTDIYNNAVNDSLAFIFFDDFFKRILESFRVSTREK